MVHDLDQAVDLSQGPLFTEALFKISADRYYWYQRIHHIVIDGFGVSLLAESLASLRDWRAENLQAQASSAGFARSWKKIRHTACRGSTRIANSAALADEPEVVSLGAGTAFGAKLPAPFGATSWTFDPSQAAAQASGTSWPDVIAATALYTSNNRRRGCCAWIAGDVPLRFGLHPYSRDGHECRRFECALGPI